MPQDPLVSVIIPAYNAEPYLEEAISSVLGQDYRPIEIIVVDDGSTDDTAGVARGFGSSVRYEFQPNSGAGAARNKGVDLARGEFLSFIDADDLWGEGKLSAQMKVIREKPEADIVFGHVQQFYSPDMDEGQRRAISIPEETMQGFHAGTMLIRRDDFLRVGHFESDLKMGEFIDWYARAKECGLKSVMMDCVLMKRRIHSNNMGTRERSHQSDYLRVLRASLQRRKNQADGG
jgi:glycosyltransferase involved in cell wall biosynthesis